MMHDASYLMLIFDAHHFVCLMGVFNKDIKDHDCLCFISLEILYLLM